MKTDGRFVIVNCDISQAIQQELGLSNEECKKLNSVWDEIIDKAGDSNNVQVTNNNNSTPTKANNYMLYNGAIVEFSKECWRWIVDKVNSTLHTNIEIEENEPDVNPKNTIIPQKVKKQPNLSQSEIAEYTKYNNISNANKEGVLIEGKYYDFDNMGNCIGIYNEPPSISVNGKRNSYIEIYYNTNNEFFGLVKCSNDGTVADDGTRTWVEYDAKGAVSAYRVEADFNNIAKGYEKTGSYDSNGDLILSANHVYDDKGKIVSSNYYNDDGNPFSSVLYDNKGYQKFSYNPNSEIDKIVLKIYTNLENLTEASLKQLLFEMSKIYYDKTCMQDEVSDIDNLYFVMKQYQECTGNVLLEDIAKVNPKLADYLIDLVKTNENTTVGKHYKYTQDILDDMAEHPNDYKKLSVDLQRLMHRPWIDKNEEHGDDVLNLNNAIDEKVQQTVTGNCYLVTTIEAIDGKELGRKALASIRKDLPNGDVLITCKGNNKTYLIKKEEILAADYLSTGDDDMRVWELAMDKYRRDMAYESVYASIDGCGGTSSDVIIAFFGLDVDTSVDLENFDFANFNDENKIYSFSILDSYENGTFYPKPTNANNEQVNLSFRHAYRIIRTENGKIYFTNPWDNFEELSMSIEEFKKMKNIEVEEFDLQTYKF